MRWQYNKDSLLNFRCERQLKTQVGLLFIEYMIAIVIGTSIMLFIFEIYRSMRFNHQFIQQIYHAYTEAETLISLINHDIHAARRQGCETINNEHLVYDNSKQQFIHIQPPVVNKRSIRLTHTEAHYGLLLADARHQVYLEVSPSLRIHQDEKLLISDCINTELIRVLSVHQMHDRQRVYITHPLHFTFQKNAMISKMVMVELALDERKKNGTVNLTINGQRTPVVHDIDDLQFTLIQAKGVRYQFTVKMGKVTKEWYGYAIIK